MRTVTVAATQFACSWDLPAKADRAEALIRQVAAEGTSWGLFRDRRPGLYGAIGTLDGRV